MFRRSAFCLLTLSVALAGCGSEAEESAKRPPKKASARTAGNHQPDVTLPEQREEHEQNKPKSKVAPDIDELLNDPTADDIPALISHLSHKEKRRKLETAITSFGGRAVPYLVAALLDDTTNETVRLRAAALLRRIGPTANQALPQLLPALKSKNESIRLAAAIALAHIDPHLEGTVEVLEAGLSDPSSEVRLASLHALTALGEKAKPATASIIELLADKDEELRRDASFALHSVGVESNQLPLLLKLLDNERARPHVVETLTGMRQKAAGAAPPLIELLRTGNVEQRQQVGFALAGIGKPALPGLKQLAADTEADTSARMAAVRTIGLMGRHAVEAAGFLRGMLENAEGTDGDEFIEFRRTIRKAVEEIDPHPPE